MALAEVDPMKARALSLLALQLADKASKVSRAEQATWQESLPATQPPNVTQRGELQK